MSIESLKMFWYYTSKAFKSRFQYKLDAILVSFAVFIRESAGILVIYLTLMKFDNINGWNINEMLFLFSLLFLTYAILVIFFTGLRDFSYTIQQGLFDRIMLRPRGLLFQLMSSDSDCLAALGHGTLGILLFILSANNVGIIWNAKTILYYIFILVGGVLIQGAIFLFFASLNFFFVKTENLREIFYWNVRKFAGYPISIFNKTIQFLLMFIIPFAFVNYFPAQYLLRKEDMINYPLIFMYITPLVGIVLYLLAYGFWKFSVRYYKSTGN
ncbi:ABC-2 family transporter protein [Clostridium sp.]|uniref:ABC transporter permease n=1 Tax=Clostridium sp. TaxID=1506 RepID=UPI002613249C|nr:ABC-2 family transporter protein [Clostridium sp.]